MTICGAGLDFAGVHDSFWTHAGTVDTMNRVLRENFVQLHSQPLLERLLQEFQALYPHLEFPELPSLVRCYNPLIILLEKVEENFTLDQC